MVKVLYWKKGPRTAEYLNGRVPTGAQEVTDDYAVVWEGKGKAGTAKEGTALLDHFYRMFNTYSTNPLSGDVPQQKLRDKGVGHTSLSVGDIVEVNGVKWLCLWDGWATLKSLQAGQNTALAAHAGDLSYRDQCQHVTVKKERCTLCKRIVRPLPRLTR